MNKAREADIRARYEALVGTMNERMTRLWLGAEAKTFGRGGVLAVSRATGILPKRVSAGVREIASGADLPGRIRRPGAGRKPLSVTDPGLWPALDMLIEPATRGDPESPLRWTSKSLRKLALELRSQGHAVSPTKVGELLHQHGYTLQAMKKTLEGSQHPDRDAQFEHIYEETKAFQAAGQPTVSVDTKNKELVGEYKKTGIEWQPEGTPVKAPTHDFPDPAVAKAIPYGVYDTARNEGWVSVGTDHDTSEFAVATLLAWWWTMGIKAYAQATRLLIMADSGGSNGYRRRTWKLGLQRFANETGLSVTVCHFPPGTSKWNKIEHRLFSAISQNWRGRPLRDYQTVVSLIGHTKTTTGLRVRAKLDKRKYPTGIRVTNAQLREIDVARHDFHGEWNYTVRPQTSA